MEWISILDELPTKYGEYMVITLYQNKRKISGAIYLKTKQFFSHHYNAGKKWDIVTHWLKLDYPKLPSIKECNEIITKSNI